MRLRFSRTTDYGLRAALEVARAPRRDARDTSRYRPYDRAPASVLAQSLASLVRAGILDGQAGPAAATASPAPQTPSPSTTSSRPSTARKPNGAACSGRAPAHGKDTAPSTIPRASTGTVHRNTASQHTRRRPRRRCPPTPCPAPWRGTADLQRPPPERRNERSVSCRVPGRSRGVVPG